MKHTMLTWILAAASASVVACSDAPRETEDELTQASSAIGHAPSGKVANRIGPRAALDRWRRDERQRTDYAARFNDAPTRRQPAEPGEPNFPPTAAEMPFSPVDQSFRPVCEAQAFHFQPQLTRKGALILTLVSILSRVRMCDADSLPSSEMANVDFAATRGWMEELVRTESLDYKKLCKPVRTTTGEIEPFRHGKQKFACELTVPRKVSGVDDAKFAFLFSQRPKGWLSADSATDIVGEIDLLSRLRAAGQDYFHVVPTDDTAIRVPCADTTKYPGTQCTGYLELWMDRVNGSEYQHWHHYRTLLSHVAAGTAGARPSLFGIELTAKGHKRFRASIDKMIAFKREGNFIRDAQGFIGTVGPDQGTLYIADPQGLTHDFLVPLPRHVAHAAEELEALVKIRARL